MVNHGYYLCVRAMSILSAFELCITYSNAQRNLSQIGGESVCQLFSHTFVLRFSRPISGTIDHRPIFDVVSCVGLKQSSGISYIRCLIYSVHYLNAIHFLSSVIRLQKQPSQEHITKFWNFVTIT